MTNMLDAVSSYSGSFLSSDSILLKPISGRTIGGSSYRIESNPGIVPAKSVSASPIEGSLSPMVILMSWCISILV